MEHRVEYSPKELAKLTGWSVAAILVWINQGRLKSTKYGGPARYRHRISDDQWQEYVATCNQ